MDHKALYEGKYFYDISDPFSIKGPYSNILYKTDMTGFVQMMGGKAMMTFTNAQILVTDKLLVEGTKPRLKLDVPNGCALPQSYCSDCSCGKKDMVEDGRAEESADET